MNILYGFYAVVLLACLYGYLALAAIVAEWLEESFQVSLTATIFFMTAIPLVFLVGGLS